MAETPKASEEILVFISTRDATCGECGNKLYKSAWITLAGEKGPVCLACADLDHLVFLPAGNVALTRRSKKYSTLSAVVLQWSRSRKRNERQGLLVEEAALEKAELECLADSDAREIQRERAAIRRGEEDLKFIERFTARVREVYPSMPLGVEKAIAEHACQKYSGRVGRSANAKDLDFDAVQLAVRAHIRHVETPYDELLMKGTDRSDARSRVKSTVDRVADDWARGR